MYNDIDHVSIQYAFPPGCLHRVSPQFLKLCRQPVEKQYIVGVAAVDAVTARVRLAFDVVFTGQRVPGALRRFQLCCTVDRVHRAHRACLHIFCFLLFYHGVLGAGGWALVGGNT